MENVKNEDDDIEPSLGWLIMDTDALLKVISRYEISRINPLSIDEAKMFHHILLNLMTRDDPKIHTRNAEMRPKSRVNCYSPVVDCLRRLYEEVKLRDVTDHQLLLQSPWIRTVIKIRADAWHTSLERLSNTELHILEYAEIVLRQDVKNKYLENYFWQLGTDIMETFKDKSKPHIGDSKLSVIFSICKSLATTMERGSFDQEQIKLLRIIFCHNTAYKRPTFESLSQVAKRMHLESLMANDK